MPLLMSLMVGTASGEEERSVLTTSKPLERGSAE